MSVLTMCYLSSAYVRETQTLMAKRARTGCMLFEEEVPAPTGKLARKETRVAQTLSSLCVQRGLCAGGQENNQGGNDTLLLLRLIWLSTLASGFLHFPSHVLEVSLIFLVQFIYCCSFPIISVIVPSFSFDIPSGMFLHCPLFPFGLPVLSFIHL